MSDPLPPRPQRLSAAAVATSLNRTALETQPPLPSFLLPSLSEITVDFWLFHPAAFSLLFFFCRIPFGTATRWRFHLPATEPRLSVAGLIHASLLLYFSIEQRT